jgi:hypothetical protein
MAGNRRFYELAVSNPQFKKNRRARFAGSAVPVFRLVIPNVTVSYHRQSLLSTLFRKKVIHSKPVDFYCTLVCPFVVGFIENSGRNFTCCGCWKAYGDPQAAQRHFAQLRKCTAVYLRLFHSGTPILRLAVAA